MNSILTGMGWVTPLGRGLQEVQTALLAGVIPELQRETNPASGVAFPVFRPPADCLGDVASFPRLRRSSAISHFAVAAAQDAAAGLTAEQRARTALVFAASDGGVVYTRKFYGDVVERHGGAGSPLLFPETVYNAPASHIAARLGLEGESLTLVGDVEVGLDAVQTACELLACGDADHCLVVAAQELDWITCEAYSRWGLTGPDERTGAVFSEGAGAILLSREGQGCLVESVATGPTRIGRPASLPALAENLPSTPDLIVSSDSGTPQGKSERETLLALFTGTALRTPKTSLGEAMACSTIQQVIFAALCLENSDFFTSLACATGFNGQISALFLTATSHPA